MIEPEKFAGRSFLTKIGLYLVFMITAGGIGGILIYIFLMQFSGWDLKKKDALFPTLNAADQMVIHFYESPATTRYFASVGGRYEVLTRPWRDYAASQNLKWVDVSSLDQLDADKSSVLVLASAVALSEEERRHVMQYRTAGGNVLLTWATGARNGNGEWVGWDFVKQVAGVEVAAELPPTQNIHQILTQGEGPLTHDMAPASRIGLGTTTERPILYKGGNTAARVQDDAFAWSSPESPLGVLVFNEFSEQKGSRVVAFGAPETTWAYNRDQIHQLLNGALGWLTRQPTVVKGHWPMGFSSAYMIAVNAPEAPIDAQGLSRTFQSSGYEGSFFFPSSVMSTQKNALTEIEKNSEIAYLGDSSAGFKGQTESVQSQRIGQMVSSAPSTSPKPRVGFQAPDSSFDAVTEQLLYKNRVQYHLSKRPQYHPRQPNFGDIGPERVGERFVILPLQDGDVFNLSASGGSTPADFFTLAMRHHDNITDQAAFGCLLVQLGPDGTNQNINAEMQRLISHIRSKQDTTWLANGRDISTWWNDRDRFQLRVRASRVRIEFDISNVGDTAIANASVIVMLPDKNQLPQVRSLKMGLPEPTVKRLDEYRAAIVFASLPKGDFSYQVTF